MGQRMLRASALAALTQRKRAQCYEFARATTTTQTRVALIECDFVVARRATSVERQIATRNCVALQGVNVDGALLRRKLLICAQ